MTTRQSCGSDQNLAIDPRTVRAFRRNLRRWFETHARDLPWRTNPRDPYVVWISEVMLQQTRVTTVIPFFKRFITRFPNLEVLANAPLDEVLAAWSGLGYYRRARALHAAAKQVHNEYAGEIPANFASLLNLSGVGQYTAAAIASMAFSEPVAVVDGNVLRVLARFLAETRPIEDRNAQRRIRATAQALLDPNEPGTFNEALMELGATVCTPLSADCRTCPVRSACRAHHLSLVDEIPTTRGKKSIPRVHLKAFVVTYEDETMLCRRVEGGLFGGLWEPPMVEAPARKERRILTEKLGRGTCLSGSIHHVLTHRLLEVQLLLWQAPRKLDATELIVPKGYDQTKWVSQTDQEGLGMSSLASKVLARGLAEKGSGEKE